MDDRAAAQPTILLVGTGHWGNPGQDLKNVEFDDMLAPDRQSEIEDCLTRLARFAPAKVALEITLDQVPAMNEAYRRYREGEFALTAHELHQLGFRLAAMADCSEVHGIDWHDVDRPIPWERAIAYALERGQEHLVSTLTTALGETAEDKAAENGRIRQLSVRDHLLATNTPEAMAASHRVYMDLAQVGEGDDSCIGAGVVLRWYERNMMMFVNIARIASGPEDRVLVVVGGGHLPLLSRYLRDARAFRLEHVGDYLTRTCSVIPLRRPLSGTS